MEVDMLKMTEGHFIVDEIEQYQRAHAA